jgi:hypothetical protein
VPTIEKINSSTYQNVKILVAPLDWGLGHATRCIPVIKELLNQQCEVWIAAAGAQRTLLQEEFPLLSFVEIPGYQIKYGKNRAFTILRLLGSVPKILIRIKQEKAWLRTFLAAERPDIVISDNRYGLYAPGLCSIFITHQLRIRTPFGPMADWLVQRMNYFGIRRFTRCWIPDEEDAQVSLAGELSHPARLPVIPIRYIGWLSRFDSISPSDGFSDDAAGDAADSADAFGTDSADAADANGPQGSASSAGAHEPRGSRSSAPIDLLVLLSGPEPQRTLLEKILLDQSAGLEMRITLVRGLPGGRTSDLPVHPSNLTVFDHLPAKELAQLIRRAGLVLSRAGYSTLMELARLGKRAILVPTPGQTEQEYLGKYLAKRGWVCMEQKGFLLADALVLGEGRMPDEGLRLDEGGTLDQGGRPDEGVRLGEGVGIGDEMSLGRGVRPRSGTGQLLRAAIQEVLALVRH